MATIAFCGLGMMGWQMAKRLRDAGHELRVWNRTVSKTREWAAAGGSVCETPEEAARGASQVHFMLADDAAVEASLFGTHGAIAGLSRNCIVVDHSTVSVAGTRQRAARLATGGWHPIQAPVFAGPMQIAAGEGVMLIGGEANAYDAARSVLSQILSNHFVAGTKPEEAAAFKLMGNSMLVSINEGLAEFFAIAQASGIAPDRAFHLFDVFNASGTITRRGPRMVAGDYSPPTFALAMAMKDVRLMLGAVDDDAKVPALKAIEGKMRRLVDQGYAQLDMSALAADVIAPRA
jgi:3-hydroxyisobutyrate dehydrogenase